MSEPQTPLRMQTDAAPMVPHTALLVGARGGLGQAWQPRLLQHEACEALLACRRGPLAKGGVDQSTGRGRTIELTLDLEDPASIEAAAQAAREHIERLGLPPLRKVIVASGLLHAPALQPEKSLRALDAFTLHRLMAVNAIGPALVARHLFPLMPRQGRVVFAAVSARVGSISDNRLGGWYGYRASKAALNQFIRTLAIEWSRTAKESVCVALHPGTVDTPLSQPFQGNVPEGRLFTPDESVGHLEAVLQHLGPQHSGRCYAWDGQEIAP